MDREIFGVLAFSMLMLAPICYATTGGNTPSTTIDSTIKGHWVVDPRQAGNNLPPEGRSLFDFAFSKSVNGKFVYDIPFPYSKLIRKLEKFVQPDNILESQIKQVLVPLGRSLARNIARPDFFLYPRVVSVVDTEPRSQSNNTGIMLKDRLYIGYGEAAEILEIISYNEAAGRFEFQVVTNYKAGGKPQVFYANREVCAACHQNNALIFSRQQWDETNSNPRIAALLSEHRTEFYGIPVNRGVDIPFAIDAATDRANLFSLYQLLWQQGCEAKDENSINSVNCRQNLLGYVMQYLLSNRNQFNNDSDYYRNNFLPDIRANWKNHWADGLLIPDPDIPNRDPLLLKSNSSALNTVSSGFSSKASSTLNDMLAKNDVSDKFEPLNYRPPQANWDTNQQDLDKILISGLASFIPDSDIQRLDKQLSTKRQVSLSTYELSCIVDDNRQKPHQRRVKFFCESQKNAISLKGRFLLDRNKFKNGKVSKLSINELPQFDLILKAGKVNLAPTDSSANLFIQTASDFSRQSNLLTARLPNGNAIDYFKLQWNPTNADRKSIATLFVRHDFELVKQSIDKLASLTINKKSDALSNKPFRRASVMKAILENLGENKHDWCCVNSSHLPKARLQDPDNEVAIVSQAANPEIAPFYHYCSVCHRTSNSQPPNFLQGNEAQVVKNINQCAERIFFRLSMWQQNSAGRAKSPMPPATALHKLGFTQRHWKASDELSSLKHAVAKVISRKTGKDPDIRQYIKIGFNNLPECLPQS